MPATRITITGLVQGVFFRAESQQKAQELGLTGWVRNTSEGAVEIHAEGPKNKLKEFEEWCRQGPSRADVRDIATTEVAEEHSTSFEIIS